ncbi:MAG TPA: hypothetical protein VM889_06170 [Candidatus Thermoplasmatota archaeon]|nr:hypothetical protein [Candidatus Thermoplasmatota archaeon]
MHARFAVALAVVTLVAAAFAASAVPAADERESIGLLGQVTMKKNTRPLANGNATVEADVTVNGAAARDAGARFVLVSVGSDGSHGAPAPAPGGNGTGNGTGGNATNPPAAKFQPIIKDGHLRVANDPRTAYLAKEGAGTKRLNFWYEAARLDGVMVIKVVANTTAGTTPADVEVMIMAFNGTYGPIMGADGRPLVVQSFTTLGAREATPPPSNGTGGPAPNETVDGDGAPTSALGLVGVALAVVAVAAVARRR